MVYASICLDCGSIRWREYGTYDRHFYSSMTGAVAEESTTDFEGSICDECSSDRIVEFDLNDLSDQERVLFFHYSSPRRLLMILRLRKKIEALSSISDLSDSDVKERIKSLENELNI